MKDFAKIRAKLVVNSRSRIAAKVTEDPATSAVPRRIEGLWAHWLRRTFRSAKIKVDFVPGREDEVLRRSFAGAMIVSYRSIGSPVESWKTLRKRTDYISVYYCLRCNRMHARHLASSAAAAREKNTAIICLSVVAWFDRGRHREEKPGRTPRETSRDRDSAWAKRVENAFPHDNVKNWLSIRSAREQFRAGSHCYSNYNPTATSDPIAITAQRALSRDAWRRPAIFLRIFSGSGQSGRDSDALVDVIARHVTRQRATTVTTSGVATRLGRISAERPCGGTDSISASADHRGDRVERWPSVAEPGRSRESRGCWSCARIYGGGRGLLCYERDYASCWRCWCWRGRPSRSCRRIWRTAPFRPTSRRNALPNARTWISRR